MIYKKNYNIIDCTLRDDSYCNNLNFPNELINKYLTSLFMIEINKVEIGFLTITLNNKDVKYS